MNAESVRWSWISAGVVSPADAPATCSPCGGFQTLRRLGGRRSLFSGSTPGLHASIKHRGGERQREREREREGEEELPSSPSPLLPLVLPLNHRAKKHSLTTSADPPLGRPLPALCILERFHRRLSSLPFHCIIRNDPHSLNRKLFHLKSSGDGLFSLNSSAAQRNHFDKVSYRIMDAGMDLHRTVHSA